jgi:hypothetical protein
MSATATQQQTTPDTAPDGQQQLLVTKVASPQISATNDPNLGNVVITSSVGELRKLIKPQFPINVYISGDTGLGKSTSVMWLAKQMNMPCIRVSISFQTDVDDLIGGLRLEKDGETTITKFVKGPVIQAMEMENCILLLDEIDTSNPRVVMELQAILELKGYLIKKTGEMVYPAKGFRVIATGNTKGLGDMSGRFVATNPLNEAFRDRFHTYVDFVAPNESEMFKILSMNCPTLDPEIVECMAGWYWQIVDSRNKGVYTQIISPRRMAKIGDLFGVFEVPNVDDAILVREVLSYGLRFFEDKTKDAFLNVWDNRVSTSAQTRARQRQQKAAKALADTNGTPVPSSENGPMAAKPVGGGRFNTKIDSFGDPIPF